MWIEACEGITFFQDEVRETRATTTSVCVIVRVAAVPFPRHDWENTAPPQKKSLKVSTEREDNI